MRSHGSRQRGFTLIEAMIVLAIVCILAMIGAPAMGGLLARTRTASTEALVANTLRHARSAAVMRNTRVLVCPSRDGRRCHPGDDWQHGWIVARDADHDGQPDAGTSLIAVNAAMTSGVRVVTSAGRRQLAFHPDGGAGGSNVRFTICNANAGAGKAVILANSGRVRIAKPDPERLQRCLSALQ